MKKLFAVFWAVCLVLGLCVTGFAEPADDTQVDVATLLKNTPDNAYRGENTTIKDIQIYTLLWDHADIFFEELLRLNPALQNLQHSYPTLDKNPDAPRLSEEAVKTAYERMFGPGSFAALAQKDITDGSAKQLFWIAETKEYAYVNSSYGGGDPAVDFYEKPTWVEVEGDEIRVSLFYAVARYYATVVIDGDVNSPAKMPLFEDASLTDHQQEIYTLLKNGTFDRYIPIYVNTYKSNGDGTYYWVSTSVEDARGPIPVDMVRRLVFPGTLLKQIPGGAYEGLETPINVSNMKPVTLDRTWEIILIDSLIDKAVITLPEKECEKPLPEDNPDAPRIPLETVKKTYESLFGPGTFPAEPFETVFDGGSRHLHYDAAAKEYVFIYYSGAGGDPAAISYINPVNQSILEDGTILLSVRFAYAGDSSEYFFLHGNLCRQMGPDMAEQINVLVESTKTNNADLCRTKLRQGVYDSYLPVYEHTFKPNGDGTYYWASTVLKEKGTTIPMSEIDPALVPSTATDSPGTDTASPTTDGADATGTVSASPSVEEGSFPWGWVCVGVGVVVIVAAAVVLLRKKKL